MTGKAEIRRRINERLAGMNGEQRRLAADRAGGNLFRSPVWRGSQRLLIFMATAAEIDTEPVVRAALNEGKTVYIPRVVGAQLAFGTIDSLDDDFESGPFGIREPPSSALNWNPTAFREPDLMIVPALAFDSRGNRLGRGGGFYDRFIASIQSGAAPFGKRSALCFGFGYEQQLLENLPVEAHDRAMDGLVTEARVRMFRQEQDGPRLLVPTRVSGVSFIRENDNEQD